MRNAALIGSLALALLWSAPKQFAVAQPAPDEAGDVTAAVAGNTRLALDIYGRLAAAHEGNLICAPQSISTAMAMTWAGARTETAGQMARTLRFELDPSRLHGAFAALSEATSRDGTLVTANRI
ncbi:MAG: serpin family protein, partial [Planctomycetota bacterium]